MSAPMTLTIATPASVLVRSAGVRSLRADDASGGFGVWPGHADLLTVLPASVVRWRGEGGGWGYCALSGGVLQVAGGRRIDIACRRGALGDDLERLRAEVERLRAAEIDADRRARVEQTRLHARAIRRLMRLLRPGDGPGGAPTLTEGEAP